MVGGKTEASPAPGETASTPDVAEAASTLDGAEAAASVLGEIAATAIDLAQAVNPSTQSLPLPAPTVPADAGLDHADAALNQTELAVPAESDIQVAQPNPAKGVPAANAEPTMEAVGEVAETQGSEEETREREVEIEAPLTEAATPEQQTSSTVAGATAPAPQGPITSQNPAAVQGGHEPAKGMIEQVNATAARISSPQEPAPARDPEPPQAAPMDPKVAFSLAPASEAASGSTPAANPDQPTILQQVSSGAPANNLMSNPQQGPAVPIRVVSEVPLGAVPVEIGLKSLAGINHFEIRLDPVELGRIEVRLQIDDEGGVKAHLSVDRVETLALLQRDARTLEKAFDQAGLKLSEGRVDFSLRDQGNQGQGRQEHPGDRGRDGSRSSHNDMRRDDGAVPVEPPRRLWRGAAGVDVRI